MAIRPMFLEIKNAAGPCFHGKITGGIAVPGGIRTHDLPLRRRTLYPAELQKHLLSFSRIFKVFGLSGPGTYLVNRLKFRPFCLMKSKR